MSKKDDDDNPSHEVNEEIIQEQTLENEKKQNEDLVNSILNVRIDDTDSVLTATPATSVQGDQPMEVIKQIPEETETEDPFEGTLNLLQEFSSEYFINKHSPSFKCFEQALFSQSDITVTLHFFPPLTDPGIDAAFNYIRNNIKIIC